jgi:hypothetical protein
MGYSHRQVQQYNGGPQDRAAMGMERKCHYQEGRPKGV